MVMDWSPAAQAGGAFAVVLAALAALGRGLAWLLNWHSERTDKKSSRLDIWEANLVAREKSYRETLEHELEVVKNQVFNLRLDIGALGHSLIEVTIELREHSPRSDALVRASKVLQQAFPPTFNTPWDMQDMAKDLDK